MTLLVYFVCMYMHVEVKEHLKGIGLFCHVGPRIQVHPRRAILSPHPLPTPHLPACILDLVSLALSYPLLIDMLGF